MPRSHTGLVSAITLDIHESLDNLKDAHKKGRKVERHGEKITDFYDVL